jgi:hypothetical protein
MKTKKKILQHRSGLNGCEPGCQACGETKLGYHCEDYTLTDCCDADMKLQAAAPDLLSACKAMRDGWEGNLTKPLRLINDAIEKAEGSHGK